MVSARDWSDEVNCSLSARCVRTGMFCLLLLAALCAPAHADQSLVQEQFVAALNVQRAHGCEGRPGVVIPLGGDERLHRAAELSPPARGRSVEVLAGFRALRWSVLRIQGISDLHRVPSAVARLSCARLLDRDFTAVGFHHSGRQITIVFAMPFMPPAAGTEAAVAERVLQLVNEARSQPRLCGDKSMPVAPPLRHNAVLAGVAQAYSEDMAQHSYMGHRGRDGSMVNDRVNRSGYRWRSLAENLASGQATPEQAVEGWLKSPGHCASLMDARYRETGVAYAYSEASLDGMYWTQLFALPR